MDPQRTVNRDCLLQRCFGIDTSTDSAVLLSTLISCLEAVGNTCYRLIFADLSQRNFVHTQRCSWHALVHMVAAATMQHDSAAQADCGLIGLTSLRFTPAFCL